jgi:5-deoxy-glucuronate isomerase
MKIGNHFKSIDLLQKKSPKELGLELVSVQRIELKKELILDSLEEEICLVVIGGSVQFKCENKDGIANFKDMLYVPRRTELKLHSEGSTLMYYSAPSDIDALFTHITFEDIDKNITTHAIAGSPNNNSQRDVWKYIDSDFSCARLMMGICESSPGGWTSWPPHEHTEKREEVYVYFNMKNVFGVQCVYDDLDNPYHVAIVRDGDLISIPKGYHPNVACPAGKMSYIYCMAARKSGDRDFMDLNIQELYQGNKFF